MIAANKAEADKVAALSKATPTFQENMQSGIVGQDQTLSSATSNYGDAVAELFAHDKAMAASNTTPSFAPEGYVSNPMTKEAYSANLFADRGQQVANALKTMEARRNILGDVVQKAIDAYKYAVASKQISVDAGAKSIDQLSQLLRDEETKRKNRADEVIAASKANKSSNATGVPTVDNMTDSQVQSDFIKRYGSNAYSKLGATGGDRVVSARTLLSQVYSGQAFNPKDLMSDKENLAYDAADTLLSKIDYAINKFTGKSGPGGTGPLAQFVPQFVATKNMNELRNAIATVSPEKIKEISGVAVSDREFERLKDQLPAAGLTEEENLRRLNEMKNIIMLGQQLKILSLMDNITLNQAYDKYAPALYAQLGMTYVAGGNRPSLDSALTK